MVALNDSGHTVAVVSALWDSNTPDNNNNIGRASVYTYDSISDSWKQYGDNVVMYTEGRDFSRM